MTKPTRQELIDFVRFYMREDPDRSCSCEECTAAGKLLDREDADDELVLYSFEEYGATYYAVSDVEGAPAIQDLGKDTYGINLLMCPFCDEESIDIAGLETDLDNWIELLKKLTEQFLIVMDARRAIEAMSDGLDD